MSLAPRANPAGKRTNVHALEQVLTPGAVAAKIDRAEARRHWKDVPVIGTDHETSLVSNGRQFAGLSAAEVGECRRAQDALVEAEERFRSAFEEAPNGMVILSRGLRDGCWRWCSATPMPMLSAPRLVSWPKSAMRR
jgi:hypothetical protein